MAAILDFQYIHTSERLSVLPDPEILGLAVGISLMSSVSAETHVIEFLNRYLGFLTSAYLLTANLYY